MGQTIYCTANTTVPEATAAEPADVNPQVVLQPAVSTDKICLQNKRSVEQIKIHHDVKAQPRRGEQRLQPSRSSNEVIVNKILQSGEDFSEEQIHSLEQFRAQNDYIQMPRLQNLLLWYLENTRLINLKTLELILKSGISVKYSDRANQNALHYAIKNSTIPDNYCKILVEAGVSFEQFDNKGYNPLMLFAKSNRDLTFEMISWLSRGLSLNQQHFESNKKAMEIMNQRETDRGFNTMMLYLNNHQRLIQPKIVEFLRKSGTSLNYVTRTGQTALKVYLANKKQLKIQKMHLLETLIAVQRGIYLNIDGLGLILHASDLDYKLAIQIFRILKDKTTVNKLEEEKICLLELHLVYGKPIEMNRVLAYVSEAKSLKELLQLMVVQPGDGIMEEFRLIFNQAEEANNIAMNVQLMQLIDTRYSLKKMWLSRRECTLQQFVSDKLLVLKMMQFRKKIKRNTNQRLGSLYQGAFVSIAKYA